MSWAKLSAEASAISASPSSSGATVSPPSANTSAPWRGWCAFSSSIRKKDDTERTPSARPTIWSAARTVSAVVWTAPPMVPSASPSRTASAARVSGSPTASAAWASVMPFLARRAWSASA